MLYSPWYASVTSGTTELVYKSDADFLGHWLFIQSDIKDVFYMKKKKKT